MTTTLETEPRFLGRFEEIWHALRRHQARLGLAATTLVAALGLALLAWADYRVELPRSARALGLATAAILAGLSLWRGVIAPLRWWTKPRTAVEIEGRFPQLGQRIRTVVQYTGLSDDAIVSAGVTPSLVDALNDETEARVTPLPLDRVIPRWRVVAVGALAAVPILAMTVAALRSGEWRTALQRAALIERPYTTLAVKPGNLLVDQGEDVPIVVELSGRDRKKVVLETRPVGKPDAEWKATRLDAPEKGPAMRRESTLEKVKDPVEYRVVACPAASGAFKIDVRYPLTIKEFAVTLTPPAYTGLEPNTVKGGDVQAVEGTEAAFRVTFDTPPTKAVLEITDPSQKAPGKGKTAPPPTVVELKREGDRFTTGMKLVKDLDYKIVASTDDRRALPKNKHRIDVREDRAPRVTFEEPEEALEVHPIAEVKERIRVGDDFGVTKAGIVFRFNDGEEKTLILKDFATEKGKKPKTAANLEETLLMETLAASPQDSVTYYAFAEDNFPGEPHRTETDLRYIDIRPFKRDYKLAEPGGGDEGDPNELASLVELIARQRINLNRAHRLARQKATDRTGAEDPLKIAGFEEALAAMTREFTEGIERLANAEVESMHRAEEAMVASIEALDRGRNAEAPVAMAEALKNLVAARRELLTIIGSDSAAAAAMRAFDRKQAQKIRKPKGKDQEAEQVAADLEELAQDEDLVYATIAAASEAGMDGKAPKGEAGEEGDPKDPRDAEAKDEPKKDAEAKDAEKQGEARTLEGPKGQAGPKGVNGKKGSGKGEGEGQGEDGEGENGSGEPKKLDRRAIAEKQEEIGDRARDLEERLKRIEAASDLAKARMARAADKAEKASGALARGNTKEAAEDAKAGAGMLHDLARQVKGEIAREVADELAMARDLAEELAKRENDLAERSEAAGQGDPPGKDGPEGKGEGEKPGTGKGAKPGKGGRGPGGVGWDAMDEEDRIERLAEQARTLEEWLKQIDKRGQGKAADAVHDLLEAGAVAEIVERTERMGELRVGGKAPEIGKEARDLAAKLEMIGQSLELLHRGIVAPQMAAMVEFDRRVAALTVKLGKVRTDAEITAWHREAQALIRDLEKAGIAGAADLAEALKGAGAGGGGWHWADGPDHRIAPVGYTNALKVVSAQIKDQIQDMILKDLASARDEATPPMFREMIERYYEVLSRGASGK